MSGWAQYPSHGQIYCIMSNLKGQWSYLYVVFADADSITHRNALRTLWVHSSQIGSQNLHVPTDFIHPPSLALYLSYVIWRIPGKVASPKHKVHVWCVLWQYDEPLHRIESKQCSCLPALLHRDRTRGMTGLQPRLHWYFGTGTNGKLPKQCLWHEPSVTAAKWKKCKTNVPLIKSQ